MKELNLNEFADSLDGKLSQSECLYFDRVKAKEYKIKFREGTEEKFTGEFCAKYPYFEFKGEPISKKQAFDIICKTDYKYSILNKLESGHNADFINNWINQKQGWCNPDGTIHCTGNTSKDPDYAEILDEVLSIKLDFPFLEFMVAVEYSDKHIEDNIEMLVYAHGKTIEVYWGEDADIAYNNISFKSKKSKTYNIKEEDIIKYKFNKYKVKDIMKLEKNTLVIVDAKLTEVKSGMFILDEHGEFHYILSVAMLNNLEMTSLMVSRSFEAQEILIERW